MVSALLAIPVLGLGLGLLAKQSVKGRYFLHLGLYVGTLAVCSILGVIYSITCSLVGQRFNINILTARSFYHLCSPLLGLRFIVEGEEHLRSLTIEGYEHPTNAGSSRAAGPQDEDERGEESRPLLAGKEAKVKHTSAVLVGNHQSLIDILFLGRIFPRRATIMAKKELKWMPLLGQYLAASGAVFVDRKNNKDAIRAMTIAGEEMKRKDVSLWIFPEGTRSMSAEPNLLPFKKGAFHLAVQAGVPVIPVVCESYHRLFDGKSRFESGVLKIKVLPPIPTDGLTSADVGDLAERVRDQMLEALKEISAPRSSDRTAASSSHSSTSLSGDDTSASVRRRTSNSSTARSPSVGDAAREAGALNEEPAMGLKQAIKQEGVNPLPSEDELDEDGAVIVKRPEAN